MDYEKAYKAVLKTATHWIKDGCTDKEKICLECVFPELRESEDEKVRKCLIAMVNTTIWDSSNLASKKACLAWLEKQKEQNKCPEFCSGHCVGCEQKEQKPAEWSEEDERIRQKLIRFISSPNIEGFMLASDEQMFVSWLKSLRPMPKVAVADGVLWKPSEEHLSALLAIFNDPNNIGSQTCQLALTDLYEQLKKL